MLVPLFARLDQRFVIGALEERLALVIQVAALTFLCQVQETRVPYRLLHVISLETPLEAFLEMACQETR